MLLGVLRRTKSVDADTKLGGTDCSVNTLDQLVLSWLHYAGGNDGLQALDHVDMHIQNIGKHIQTMHYGWRRGSVVRTSVFGWRTFPDLRLIYG